MIPVNSTWKFSFVSLPYAENYTFDLIAGAACSGDCQTLVKIGPGVRGLDLVQWIVITLTETGENYLICNNCYEEWLNGRVKS